MRVETALKQYEPLAMRQAQFYYRQFHGKHELDDLFLAARLGIFDAHKTYDSNKSQFITHAYKCINFSIQRYLREHRGTIKTPSKVSDKYVIPVVVSLPEWAVAQEACADTVVDSTTSYGFDDIHHRLIIGDALDTLSPQQRTIVELVYNDRLSAREVGELLKKSTTSVYGHLRTAQTRLMSYFKEHGLESLL